MGDPGFLRWCSDWVGPGLLQCISVKELFEVPYFSGYKTGVSSL